MTKILSLKKIKRKNLRQIIQQFNRMNKNLIPRKKKLSKPSQNKKLSSQKKKLLILIYPKNKI